MRQELRDKTAVGINKAEEEKYIAIISNMEDEIITLKKHFNTH